MNVWKRTIALLTVLALAAFGVGLAQEEEQQSEEQAAQEQQTQTRTVEIQGEEVAPLGEIQVGQAQPYEESETTTVEVEVQTGAISFTVNTPTDQSPNVDIVGPNGYYQRVEVSGNGEAQLVGGLLPGVYSIAATDDNLQVAHTLVEVTSGQAVSVDVTLEELAAFEQGTFQGGAETAFPDDAFQAEEPQAIENAEFGEVNVETQTEDARFIVTGPNNYSQEFSGSFTASDLAPGVYVIAGTREGNFEVQSLVGSRVATSAVEVNVSQRVTMVPVYDIVGAETEEVEAETEEVEDVAGGGAAEEQPVEEQPVEEQPTEEQPTEEQPEDEAGEGPIEEPVEEAVDPEAEEEEPQNEEQN